MNHMLWVDHALSLLAVNFCWWLSHENASGRLPLRRLMSLSYAVLGMLVLSNMLLRSFAEFRPMLPWALMLSKAWLVFTLGVAAMRQTIMERDMQ